MTARPEPPGLTGAARARSAPAAPGPAEPTAARGAGQRRAPAPPLAPAPAPAGRARSEGDERRATRDEHRPARADGLREVPPQRVLGTLVHPLQDAAAAPRDARDDRRDDPRPQVAAPVPAQPPAPRIVHVHERAPERRLPRPAPRREIALAPTPAAPPRTPRSFAEPPARGVSIEIGRIEIRTTTPRAAAPPPRRVASPRAHVIDPGLSFGGARRW